MSIRKAQTCDVEALRSVIMQAVKPHRHVDFDEDGWDNFCKPNDIESIQKRIESKEYLTLCFLQENKIVGLIGIHNNEKINQLFVIPASSKQGVATKLWQAAKSICDANNGTGKYWVKSSTMAVSLYEAFGFHLVGELKKENGITYYPMELVR